MMVAQLIELLKAQDPSREVQVWDDSESGEPYLAECNGGILTLCPGESQ